MTIVIQIKVYSLSILTLLTILNHANCDHPCNGWILNEIGGRMAKCYMFVNHDMDYSTAEKYCHDRKSVLLMPKTEEEYEFIKNILRDDMRLTKTDLWLGAKKDNATDGFGWNDLTPMEFSKWSPGQPDNYNKEEICVEMLFWQRHVGILGYAKWNDVRCNAVNAVICEKSIPTEEYKCTSK